MAPRRAAARAMAKEVPAYFKPLIAMTADVPPDERATITYGLIGATGVVAWTLFAFVLGLGPTLAVIPSLGGAAYAFVAIDEVRARPPRLLSVAPRRAAHATDAPRPRARVLSASPHHARAVPAHDRGAVGGRS